MDAMALQETLLCSTNFGISIPHFQCFSALGHTAAARRGLSVLIRSGFSGKVVGPAHSNWVFVRVSGQEISTPTIIGSIYLPHGAASRPTQNQLAADLVGLTNGYPDTPLVLMGDFNLDLEQLQRLLRDWPGIFQISWNDGDLPTVSRQGGPTVDHICLRGCTTLNEALPRSRVLQDWDISDHYPVVNSLPAMRQHPQQVPAQTADRATLSKRIHVPEKGTEMELIADDNRWLVLAQDNNENTTAPDAASVQETEARAGRARDSKADPGTGRAGDRGADTETSHAGTTAGATVPLGQAAALTKLNSKATTLTQTCHAIAAGLELHNSPWPAGPSVVPSRLRRVINTRRKAWRTVLALLNDPTKADAKLAEAEKCHLECTKQARSLVSKFCQ
jgi:exonuclease III